MSLQKPLKKSEEQLGLKPPPEPITCIARTMKCYNTNGQFRNFKVVTLTIEEGIVVKAVEGTAFCQVEAIVSLESLNNASILNLNNNWKDGECLKK